MLQLLVATMSDRSTHTFRLSIQHPPSESYVDTLANTRSTASVFHVAELTCSWRSIQIPAERTSE